MAILVTLVDAERCLSQCLDDLILKEVRVTLRGCADELVPDRGAREKASSDPSLRCLTSLRMSIIFECVHTKKQLMFKPYNYTF